MKVEYGIAGSYIDITRINVLSKTVFSDNTRIILFDDLIAMHSKANSLDRCYKKASY